MYVSTGIDPEIYWRRTADLNILSRYGTEVFEPI